MFVKSDLKNEALQEHIPITWNIEFTRTVKHESIIHVQIIIRSQKNVQMTLKFTVLKKVIVGYVFNNGNQITVKNK